MKSQLRRFPAGTLRRTRSFPAWSARLISGILSLLAGAGAAAAGQDQHWVAGEVVDAATGVSLPNRIYIQNDAGAWFFALAAGDSETAIPYQKRNWVNTNAVEMHTTLSSGQFRVRLSPGTYHLTVERGKEYFPISTNLTVKSQPSEIKISLTRWVNMAARGWYSGDTHVHRTISEMKNLLLAEDLNVGLPLTYWITKAGIPPIRGDKNLKHRETTDLIKVDATHVIHPVNTEYEIDTVNGKRHTLGAFFVLNHRSVLRSGVPPVKSVGDQAHREGALIDLDKHDWPWAIGLIPLLPVDLFELSNNHVWRTQFAFTKWSSRAASFMGLSHEREGNEGDWIAYGLQTYYALLDCGFPLKPAAGTANGVHPVPLGFSRVYVYLPGGFGYDDWIEGLRQGRSFVTTGPMLLCRFNGELAGHDFRFERNETPICRIAGQVLSEHPVRSIEIIVNGRPQPVQASTVARMKSGAYQTRFEVAVDIPASGWAAVRCFEKRPNGRMRFAHTGPVYFTIPGRPLRPKKEEAEFLIRRTRDEIQRSRDVLSEQAIHEFQQALKSYEQVLDRAR